AVDERQAVLRAVRERDGGGAVQLDDRRRRELEQPAVEQRDLRPVDRLLEMERGGRRLQLVWPRHPQYEPTLERRASLVDLFRVPRRAILLLEQDERAGCRYARVAPSVLQQQQRVQPVHLRLV